jgi:hypothetical protein
MKKLIVMIFALSLAVGLFGCGTTLRTSNYNGGSSSAELVEPDVVDSLEKADHGNYWSMGGLIVYDQATGNYLREIWETGNPSDEKIVVVITTGNLLTATFKDGIVTRNISGMNEAISIYPQFANIQLKQDVSYNVVIDIDGLIIYNQNLGLLL